jgi:hypothetical protein
LLFIRASYLAPSDSKIRGIRSSGSVRFFAPHDHGGFEVKVKKIAKVLRLKRKKRGPPTKEIQRGFENGQKKV